MNTLLLYYALRPAHAYCTTLYNSASLTLIGVWLIIIIVIIPPGKSLVCLCNKKTPGDSLCVCVSQIGESLRLSFNLSYCIILTSAVLHNLGLEVEVVYSSVDFHRWHFWFEGLLFLCAEAMETKTRSVSSVLLLEIPVTCILNKKYKCNKLQFI